MLFVWPRHDEDGGPCTFSAGDPAERPAEGSEAGLGEMIAGKIRLPFKSAEESADVYQGVMPRNARPGPAGQTLVS